MGTRLRFALVLLLIAWNNTTLILIKASLSDTPIRNYRLQNQSSAVKYSSLLERQYVLHENHDISRPHKSDNASIRKMSVDAIFKHRAGTQTAAYVMSKSISIISLLLNIATTAIVGSGLLGSWVASGIISKMHKFGLSLSLNSSEESNRKWSLTIASCGAYFILKFRSIFSSALSRNALNFVLGLNDLGVILAISAFSLFVNTTIGGLIGCSYVSLEILASLISCGVASLLSDKMAFRLVPLDADGNAGKPNLMCNKISNNSLVGEALESAFSSAPLLASMPQYFLSMYLIASTILGFIEKYDKKKWNGTIVSWFRAGIIEEENGFRIMPDLSLRLFVLHLALMICKGLLAYIFV